MLDFSVASREGVTIRVDQVPVVRGSWFQYYAPGWTKGYYSSKWNEQTVRAEADGSTTVTYKSGDGRAQGRIVYRKVGDQIVANYRMEWNSSEPAHIEVSPGLLWAPAVDQGRLSAPNVTDLPLAARLYQKDQDRWLARGDRFDFKGPFVNGSVQADVPLILIDGRNGYPQDWAEARPSFWIGAQGLEVSPGKPVEFTATWTLQRAPKSLNATRWPVISAPLRIDAARQAPGGSKPLVPKPKKLDLTGSVVPFDGRFVYPAGKPRFTEEMRAALARRFRDIPSAPPLKLDGGLSKMGLRPGGYRLTIRPGAITVLGEYGTDGNEVGLRMAMRRLADMAYVKNGRLVLPVGTVEDSPAIAWRGAHLFVGNRAPEFQKRLWDRYLLPLGFNKVVLQCERTAWDATPNVRGGFTMSKAQLAELAQWYRDRGVEPIPLIQSLGHMEWIFAGGKNLDLAHNRAIPYSLDARKPEAHQLVTRIWDEAIRLLRPTTIHFGMDETDMRGFQPKEDELATKMWEKMMPTLGRIARRAGARPMVWGDMGLAKSEAPDATHAPDVATAERRRRAIPAGAYIADWHYKPDSKPSTFTPVLQLWKREGFRPIASTWYRPENIRGFALAADLERAGVLQTTWAGYESSEESLLGAPEQYSAFALMGDYAWSARQEQISELPYDPLALMRERLYAEPAPVATRPGQALTWGDNALTNAADGYGWRVHSAPLLSEDRLTGRGQEEIVIPIPKGAKWVRLLADCSVESDTRAPIATLTAGKRVKTLAYGHDVRAGGDDRACLRTDRSQGRSVVEWAVKPGETSLTVRRAGPIGGLRIWAITAE